jgi:hypothetical protein
MNIQSYIVHGSPATGLSANTRIGGEPLLACHQQSLRCFYSQLPC